MNLYEVNKILHLQSRFPSSLSKPKSLICKNLCYLKKPELKFVLSRRVYQKTGVFI